MSEKQALVPQLRFPEFRDAEEWKIKPLGVAFKRLTAKNSENNKNALTISAQLGLVSQLEYFNKRVAAKDLTSYYLLHRGDFAYNKSYSKGYPMGAIKPLRLYDKGVVSTLYICFRARKEFNGFFFEYYFESGLLNPEIEKIAQEGGRAHGLLNVGVSDFFEKTKISFPQQKEQQKIAHCFSSLDQLIAAQTEKIDALKSHKKGLMQQLFPREGETVPRLRFPEFWDAGEWDTLNVSDFAKITTGNKDTQNKVDDGKYPFFVRSQTVERISSYSFDCEAVLTSGDGVGVGKIYHYIVGKFDFHQRVYCIYDFASNVCGKYFYLYFSEHFYGRVMQLSAKNSVDSVRMAMIADMPVSIPCLNEQRKIVDCLFSIDALIATEAGKLSTLKTHKKGLMQQLFPRSEAKVE